MFLIITSQACCMLTKLILQNSYLVPKFKTVIQYLGAGISTFNTDYENCIYSGLFTFFPFVTYQFWRYFTFLKAYLVEFKNS